MLPRGPRSAPVGRAVPDGRPIPHVAAGLPREVLVAALAVVVTANHFVIDVAGGIVS